MTGDSTLRYLKLAVGEINKVYPGLVERDQVLCQINWVINKAIQIRQDDVGSIKKRKK